MIIHPADAISRILGDQLEGFTFAPSVGDGGHVDDHRVIADVMFSLPLGPLLPFGIAGKGALGDGWQRYVGWDAASATSFEPVSWEEVSSWASNTGVIAVDAAGHEAADGVTNYTEDSQVPDGVAFFLFPSGLVGLIHSVENLEARMEALESARA